MYTRTFRCGVFWFRTFAILMLIYRASLAFEVSTTPQVSVSVGATVELPCQTSLTDALVYWYYGNTAENATTLVVNVFKGEVIPRRDNVDMAPDFTLRITDVGVADSGVYVCKVVPSPLEGAPKSSATVLDVTDTSTASIVPSTSPSTLATTSTSRQQKTTVSTILTEIPYNRTSAYQDTPPTTVGTQGRTIGTTTRTFEGDLVANHGPDVLAVSTEAPFASSTTDVTMGNSETGISTEAPFLSSTTDVTKGSANVGKSETGNQIQEGSNSRLLIIIIVSVVGAAIVCSVAIVCYRAYRKRSTPAQPDYSAVRTNPDPSTTV